MGQHKSRSSGSALSQLKTSTRFTEEEIQEYYELFKYEYPTGKIAVEDFKRIYRKSYVIGDPSSFAEHAFRWLDANGDGTIDFYEYLSAMSVTLRGTLEEKLEAAFNMYDQDKDGAISKQEMHKLFTAISEMFGQRKMEEKLLGGETLDQYVDHMFAHLDQNHDGQITLDEFIEGFKNDESIKALSQI
ncbi:neurocalcin homolog [Clavelina lepadiformis]|uniref:EF-hand domain-containing protein n=1 Tax=Clavelina lepadiformis TaxID=159417 RepID=A0ABP0GG52_CLALP